jgi:hypothetical protein
MIVRVVSIFGPPRRPRRIRSTTFLRCSRSRTRTRTSASGSPAKRKRLQRFWKVSDRGVDVGDLRPGCEAQLNESFDALPEKSVVEYGGVATNNTLPFESIDPPLRGWWRQAHCSPGARCTNPGLTCAARASCSNEKSWPRSINAPAMASTRCRVCSLSARRRAVAAAVLGSLTTPRLRCQAAGRALAWAGGRRESAAPCRCSRGRGGSQRRARPARYAPPG